MFSEERELTERGFYWLKVNIANLYGVDKVAMDERAAYVDENYERIKKSVEDPFGEEGSWWTEGDSPWQILAAAIELVNAVESGDPASHMSSLFVTQDGSCNGLQHYAALGLDLEGGAAVNLVPGDVPSDVYTEVMAKVQERVDAEADKVLGKRPSKLEIRDNAAAKLVRDMIDRKVVKQTVMTSVYGVTYVGARAQIQARLLDKFEERGEAVDGQEQEAAVYAASAYLAQTTMESLNDLFTGARATMNFLTECAALVSQQNQPVCWMTPLNLPCVQPYRKNKEKIVNTVVQQVSMYDDMSDLPVSSSKQRSAFPPNYVHSLDSSHMLLTAIEMKERGLRFSAVHDSYWCHPQNVDEMNTVLREKFVDLYTRPLLADLRSDLVDRFPGVPFPEVPETGELELERVKESVYFFQ